MRLSEERYIAKFSPKELREYEDSLKAYRDIKNSIDTALEKGREEGREEGRVEGIEEGRAKEKLATAKRLLDMGLTYEQAAKGAGLPMEDVEKL